MELNESLVKLEEKLSKALEVFKQAQAEKHDLEQALEKIQVDSKDYEKRLEALQRELQTLRREREDVRSRVEQLLAQVNLLTKSDSTS